MTESVRHRVQADGGVGIGGWVHVLEQQRVDGDVL